MANDFRRPPELDMTPDGRFRGPVRSARPSPLVRVGVAAMVVAVVAGFAAGAALMLWLVSLLIPVAVVAGVIAYAAFRLQAWRTRRPGGRAGGYPRPTRY